MVRGTTVFWGTELIVTGEGGAGSDEQLNMSLWGIRLGEFPGFSALNVSGARLSQT
jgi:hypothetical protein